MGRVVVWGRKPLEESFPFSKAKGREEWDKDPLERLLVGEGADEGV